MLNALRDKLNNGQIVLLDEQRQELATLEIGNINAVVDDALIFKTPIEGRGEKYGFAKFAVFENDEGIIFDADVTKQGEGGTVELDSTEIVQGAVVKLTNAVFTVAG